MDPRTTIRELDVVVITIARVTVEREAAKRESLPHARRSEITSNACGNCGLSSNASAVRRH